LRAGHRRTGIPGGRVARPARRDARAAALARARSGRDRGRAAGVAPAARGARRMRPALGFHHRYVAGAPRATTVLALHGTGGTEEDLIPLAQQLAPGANVL